MESFFQIFGGIYTLFQGDPSTTLIRIGLIILGCVLLYLCHKDILDPLILVPMSLGMIAVNGAMLVLQDGRIGTIFVDPLVSDPTQLINVLQINFLQPLYTFTFSNGLIACLVFMGIGAITDISYLMATPFSSMLLAVGAEMGSVLTLPIAMAMGLTLPQSASIALIGGADGPMVLFTSLKLAPEYFVPITVIGYLYLSLTYAGYPFLIKWLVPKKLRGTAMNPMAIRKIPPAEKVVFAVVALAILCLMFPVAGPLFVCFFVGLVIKEMNVVKIREFLEGPLLYGSTFFLGLILGSLVSADIISDPVVFKLLVLGVVSLTLAALGGIGAGLLHNKISHGKANPLLGLAAVSCVPTCAKIAQKEASKANKFAMILPYAMGPNVAGVITTAIIAGIYISMIPLIK